jgi:hypothetical protein
MDFVSLLWCHDGVLIVLVAVEPVEVEASGNYRGSTSIDLKVIPPTLRLLRLPLNFKT